MKELIVERLILFLFLVAFAIVGVQWIAPKVGEALSGKMERVVNVK